jgi:hypothetical protein
MDIGDDQDLHDFGAAHSPNESPMSQLDWDALVRVYRILSARGLNTSSLLGRLKDRMPELPPPITQAGFQLSGAVDGTVTPPLGNIGLVGNTRPSAYAEYNRSRFSFDPLSAPGVP